MACSFPTNQAIVVGGGLGGMSAANTVVEHGGRVVLLDKSSFCGGNSTKATQLGAAVKWVLAAERFPGMTITYALIQMLEKVAEKTDLARIITKAKVFKLVTNGNACVGCVYEKGGINLQEFGPVILASGGSGPTTNGEHCTGDGIKMGEAIGAKTIDLEWVQVHPTGLVKPDDADAKIKFLAAEALRGVGGIILNADGCWSTF
eukprot:s1276_g9.t1